MLTVTTLPSSLECSYCILTVNLKELKSGLRQYKDLNLEHPNWLLVLPRCFLGDLKKKKINGIYKIKLINWPLPKPKESQKQTISCFKFLSLDNGESLSQIQTHTKLSSLVSFKTKTPTSPVLSEKRHQNVNGWKEFWSSLIQKSYNSREKCLSICL